MSENDMADIFDKGEAVALQEPVTPTPDVAPVAESQPEPQSTGEVATPPVAAPKIEPVPIQALLDERERRQKYEREAADLRAKIAEYEASKSAPPPDLYTDPEARLQFENTRIQQVVINNKLEQSRFLAEREYGKDVVDAAYAYFDQHPHLSHQFLTEPSPFHAAVEFYKRQKAAEVIGTDPDAYAKRIRAEVEAELRAELAKSASSPTQPARLPGSLAAAPAAGKSSETSSSSGFDAAFG